MFLLKSAIALLEWYNQTPPPIPVEKTILKSGKVIDTFKRYQRFCCRDIFLFLIPGPAEIVYWHEKMEERINGLFGYIYINTIQLLEVEIQKMPNYVRNYIEQQLKIKRISYFVTDNYDKPPRFPTFKSIETIWHGIIVLFDKRHDVLHVTFGVNSRLCRTYDTNFIAFDELKIEINDDHIKIIDQTIEKYAVCFPEEMFPELKFCRLLMTPPNNPWYDFLFRGLYDPRLLCLVWSFASKI